MKYQIAYLDTYGNAKVLADEIMTVLPSGSTEVIDLSCQEISDEADVYVIGFDTTQSTIPLEIMDVLEVLEGKTVLCFVTSGMALFENQESVERKLSPFLPDECDYRGLFFCPGQLPPNVLDSLRAARLEQPESKQAELMLKGYQHSLNHPDAEDRENLCRFILESHI